MSAAASKRRAASKPELRLQHRGIDVTVKPSEQPGFHCFEFQIGDEVVRGRVKTRLAGIAMHRARRVIERKLKQNA